MTTKHRTPAKQEKLNGYMRRRDVLEYFLFQSVQAEPATPDEVKAFLATAPPEVFVLLDGLTGRTSSPDRLSDDDLARNERITAGVIGFLLARGRR